MTSKLNETELQNTGARLSPDADDSHPTAGQTHQAGLSPSSLSGELARQPFNFVGLGLHLPRQRGRPRGTVERFGTRPENWRGLYYVYVVENGIDKRAQRRPVLGPTT